MAGLPALYVHEDAAHRDVITLLDWYAYSIQVFSLTDTVHRQEPR